MKPCSFPGSNVVYAKDQPQYLPLPAHLSYDFKIATTCWQMTWRERFKALFAGRIWVQQMVWACPLQPQRIAVDQPPLPPGA